MKILKRNKRLFDKVMGHYKFDEAEILLAKECYERDPEAWQVGIDAFIRDEIDQTWRESMASGITERIRAQQAHTPPQEPYEPGVIPPGKSQPQDPNEPNRPNQPYHPGQPSEPYQPNNPNPGKIGGEAA